MKINLKHHIFYTIIINIFLYLCTAYVTYDINWLLNIPIESTSTRFFILLMFIAQQAYTAIVLLYIKK